MANKSAANNQQKEKPRGYVIVEGVGNLMHHIARCCQPIPGDHIMGYITMGRGFPFTAVIANNSSNYNKLIPNEW